MNGSPLTGAVAVGEWVTRSGISVVFALALLWWVLGSQTSALERITRDQASLAHAIERVQARLDVACLPAGPVR